MLLTFVLFYRSVIRVPASVKTTIVRYRRRPEIQYGIKIPQEINDEYFMARREPSQGHIVPDQKYYFRYSSPSHGHVHPYLEPLLQCPHKPNPHTNHIRLRNLVQNVSQLTFPDESTTSQKFNPTIFALPPWSSHQYLLVSRVVTEGLHQESLLCEADTCYSGHGPEPRRFGEKDCTADDLSIVGAAGGLHCATPPSIISIPPTPAERCEGTWASFPDIPGFHDPRIFWSGKGEPLIMVNSASRYACVGLWMTDLRTLHEPLRGLLTSQPGQPHHPGPLMSYPSLTELTRNPAATRASVEKNWFLFFPTPQEAFLHYDLSIPRTVGEGKNKTKVVGGRTFGKLIGNGFTTPNLTDPNELPCLHDEPDTRGKFGHWHQTSNSLKLILCRRGEAERERCSAEQDGRAVHFAIMHRKFSNEWDLPLRYERFFVVWDTRPPYRMLAISRYPLLMWNETASGWDEEENWVDDIPEDNGRVVDAAFMDGVPHQDVAPHEMETTTSANLTKRIQKNTTSYSNPDTQRNPAPKPHANWAYFTYTPSIAWAFRPSPAIPLRDSDDSDQNRGPSNHRRRRPNDLPNNNDPPSSDEHDPPTTTPPNEPPSNEPTDTSTPDPEAHHHTHTLHSLNDGYLDDEVILGIGLDDQGQGVARVKASDLLACLKLCPQSRSS